MNNDVTASSMNDDGDSSHSVSLGDFIFPRRQPSSLCAAVSPQAAKKTCRDIVTIPYYLTSTSGKAGSGAIAEDSLSHASSDKHSSMSSLSDSPRKTSRPCVRFDDSAMLRKLAASRSSMISLDDSLNSIDLELALPNSTPALSPLPNSSPVRHTKSIKLLDCDKDRLKMSCHENILNDNFSIDTSVIDNGKDGEGEGDSTSTHEFPTRHMETTDEDDSPEAIVRRETTTLRVFRVFLYLLMAAVMAFGIFLAYTNYSLLDQESFQSQFDAISISLVTALLRETHVKLLMVRAAVPFVTQLRDEGERWPLNLSVPIRSGAETLLTGSNAVSLSWGPILRTRKELELYETYANATEPIGIFRIVDNVEVPGGSSSPPYLPIWQGVGESEDFTMFNQFSDDLRARSLNQMLATQIPVLSEVFIREGVLYRNSQGQGEVGFSINAPVFSETNQEDIVGAVTAEFLWSSFLWNTRHPIHSDLVDVVVENSCGQAYTFQATDASELALIAESNVHDNRYDEMSLSTTFDDFDALVLESTSRNNASEFDYCRYRFAIYATSDLQRECTTNKPAIAAVIASLTCLLIAGCFISYDFLVSRRQKKVMETAKRSTKIVSSLFPKSFRGRIYNQTGDGGSMCTGAGSSTTGRCYGASAKGGGDNSTYPSSQSHSTASACTNGRKLLSIPQRNRLKSFLEASNCDEGDSDPIADYYPEATVMFLDIVGFTAWSSEREPTQVFRLLEAVFRSLDEVLHRYGVFKIETIGDSYVCVTGVPQRMEDHAVAMTRFAFESLQRFNFLTKQLETQLGPATGELQARIGLHSGPVTAGVIRGERARFQLFGDTMNTASRMESNGAPGRIQSSEATAILLRKAGKDRWLTARSDLVTAKGKGRMQTYWLAPASKSMRNRRTNSDDELSDMDCSESRRFWADASTDTSSLDPSHSGIADLHLQEAFRVSKQLRLVDWNVEILSGFLQKIVLSRGPCNGRPRVSRGSSMASLLVSEDEGKILGRTGIVLHDLVDVIEMPRFDARQARRLADGELAELDPAVKGQLREYVMRIASMHRDLPFHDFEHTSHVTMSAAKLLGRLSKFQRNWNTEKRELDSAKEVHQATYGISSDPLMQFVVVLASLVHDVDHTGLTNAQLTQVNAPKAIMYKNRSVSEQNSLEVAWTVLMDSDFEQMRSCIYTNKQELRRFRQLLVNAFLATDLADETLVSERKANWGRAFTEGSDGTPAPNPGRIKRECRVDEDRKATVVFECMVQAAQVAHAMQHWITFTKWSEKLFTERMLMAESGDGEPNNTANGWFQTELDFFDLHVIPLTEKLNDSGVFGSSSCEFLTWALENRREWELRGEALVERMRATFSKSQLSSPRSRPGVCEVTFH